MNRAYLLLYSCFQNISIHRSTVTIYFCILPSHAHDNYDNIKRKLRTITYIPATFQTPISRNDNFFLFILAHHTLSLLSPTIRRFPKTRSHHALVCPPWQRLRNRLPKISPSLSRLAPKGEKETTTREPPLFPELRAEQSARGSIGCIFTLLLLSVYNTYT